MQPFCFNLINELFIRVGLILSKYKSGPLPKAFKMIPALPQWARILALTNPTNWTPHATLAATRILISNLKPDQARWYLEGVLLERVRTNMEDSHQGRKLDVHLFDALKKALYKPGAFFKGILFPLVQVPSRFTSRRCAYNIFLGRMYAKRSSDHRIGSCQGQNSYATFCSRVRPSCKFTQLFWCVAYRHWLNMKIRLFPHFLLKDHLRYSLGYS